MRIRRLDPQTIEIAELDLLGCELLHQISANAEVGDDPAAQRRIYSSPTAGREPQLEAEWREYVQPELHDVFQSAIDVVEGDLAHLPRQDPAENCTVRIPVAHLDAWMHALTQARLVLAARHHFTEDELDDDPPLEGGTRALALFHMHVYAFLLECLVREAERSM